MNKSLAARCSKLHPYLPAILVVLFCLQPLLDILSYWQDALSVPFSLSFVPRTLILALLFVGGYALSDRKKYYWIMAGVLAAFFGLHVYTCYTNGIVSFTEDTSNFIRVLQLPVTTMCMITCLRCRDDCLEAIERGIFYTMLILAVSFVVSTATGTEPHTYPDQEVGIRGYSFWPNAQSAILSLCAPVSIGWILKKHPNKPVLCIGVMVLSLLLLYLHGTRLAFGCMIMTSLGMAIVIFITKAAPKKYAWILVALTVVGFGTFLPSIGRQLGWFPDSAFGEDGIFSLSPMADNQSQVAETTVLKSEVTDSLLTLGHVQVENGTSAVLTYRKIVERPTGMEAFALSDPLKKATFTDIREDDLRTEYIAYCQTLGLLSGINSVYEYAPEDDMTVLQAICIGDNVYERFTGKKAYEDYSGSTWYEGYVKRAEVYGLIPDGVEDYEQPLTRAQAAQLLYFCLSPESFPQTCDVESLRDVTPDMESYEAIMTLARAGVTFKRYQSEYFNPDRPISRGEFAVMLAMAIHPDFRLCDEGYTPMSVTAPVCDLSGLSQEDRTDAEMYPLYSHFCNGLVGRFGIHKVLEAYDYTTDTEVLISEREWKLQFCYILMDSSTPLSRFFGLEVTRMFYNGTSYDVENDFHGIYLLYGWVGLAMMLAFLGFFLFWIIRALIRDFKRYFTLEAGAIGIALIACFVHAYFTCGVLRRANTLFYFAGLLAAAYYLVAIKRDSDPSDTK